MIIDILLNEDLRCSSCGQLMNKLYLVADTTEEADIMFSKGLGSCAGCAIEAEETIVPIHSAVMVHKENKYKTA